MPSVPLFAERSYFMCMVKDSVDLSLDNLWFMGRGPVNPLSMQRSFGHLWSLRQNASSALPKSWHWFFGGGQRCPWWLCFFIPLCLSLLLHSDCLRRSKEKHTCTLRVTLCYWDLHHLILEHPDRNL